MDKLDSFLHDLKLILWSTQAAAQREVAASDRLAAFVENVLTEDESAAHYLITVCSQRLKMLEHIAGAIPILRQLERDLDRQLSQRGLRNTS